MAEPDEKSLRELVRKAVLEALSESNDPVTPNPAEYFAPWTGVSYDAHPSQQHFNIPEAKFSAGDILEFVEAQRCMIEKDKACDHCSMCRSLGY